MQNTSNPYANPCGVLAGAGRPPMAGEGHTLRGAAMSDVIDPDGKLPRDFPLQVGGNNQYRKSYKGQKYPFGTVAGGWRAALERYSHDWPFILRGERPPKMIKPGEVDPRTFQHVATEFLARELKAWRNHEMGVANYADKRAAVEITLTVLGLGRMVQAMRPDDWGDLRKELSKSWARTRDETGAVIGWRRVDGQFVGPDTLRRRVGFVREMMSWAAENLGIPAARYGDEFAMPGKREIRRARALRAEKHGDKRWELDELARIVEALDVQLRAMFLLSIYGGFTEADCIRLPWSAINWKDSVIRFVRGKSGMVRAFYAPPDLVKALRAVQAPNLDAVAVDPEAIVWQEYEDGRPVGDPIKAAHLVFLHNGRPWGFTTSGNDKDGAPVTTVNCNKAGRQFAKRIEALGIKRARVGFGAGRHTLASHGPRVADKALVDYVMGHQSEEAAKMTEWYQHPPIADLKAFALALWARYFPDQQNGAARSPMRMAS
jgi:integrase